MNILVLLILMFMLGVTVLAAIISIGDRPENRPMKITEDQYVNIIAGRMGIDPNSIDGKLRRRILKRARKNKYVFRNKS